MPSLHKNNPEAHKARKYQFKIKEVAAQKAPADFKPEDLSVSIEFWRISV
jgi:ribosomal protein S3AE